MPAGEQHRSEQSVRQEGSLYALFVLILVNAFWCAETYMAGPLKTPIMKDFQLTDFQTTLPKVAEKSTLLVFLLVFGWAMDSKLVARSRLLWATTTLWTVASALTSLCPTFGLLCLSRACVGLGKATNIGASISLMADFFPITDRIYAIALYHLAEAVGGAIGIVVASLVAPSYGWRAAYACIGLSGIAASSLILFMREPSRRTDDVGPERLASGDSFLQTVSFMASNKYYIAAVAASVAGSFMFEGVSDWYSTFLLRYHDMSVSRAGILMAVASFGGGIGGALLGATATARMQRYVKSADVLACATLSTTCAGVLLVGLRFGGDSFIIHTVIALLFLVSYFACFAPRDALLTNVMPPQILSFCFGCRSFCCTVMGDDASAPVVGAVSDMTGSLKFAMQLLVTMELLAALVWWSAYFLLAPTPVSSHPSDHSLLDAKKSDNTLEDRGGDYGSTTNACGA